MELTIAHFCPDLLNLYGDRGNIVSIRKRCEWRGVDVRVKEYSLDSPVDFSEIDIAILGGGSDREQFIVAKKLQYVKNDFVNYIENGGVVLAVCGGYQLLGEYYQLENCKINGLNAVEIYTLQSKKRLISNVILQTKFGKVVGFENHAGRTYINTKNEAIKPFGKVLYGHGNNGEDGYEGIIYNNVIGTYLHGPLLPKNPAITDEIIRRAIKQKYHIDVELKELNDAEETEARQSIINRFIGK